MVQIDVFPRSFLYVPADRPDLFDKAAAGDADAIIFDLEDAVPVDRKTEARRALRGWFEANLRETGKQCWVRVNRGSIAEDLRAVTLPGLAGIMQAKSSRSVLLEAGEELTALEGARGIDPLATGIIGLIEDARGLEDLAEMASVPRLVTFAIGEVDLMADLRMSRTDAAEPALDSIRARIVVACAASGLRAPLAPTSTEIREIAEFGESSRKLRDLGFRSRTAIHPSQIAVIHDVFTPSAQDAASARDVIARLGAAGGGVALDAAGRMIDAAVVRGAQEILERSTR